MACTKLPWKKTNSIFISTSDAKSIKIGIHLINFKKFALQKCKTYTRRTMCRLSSHYLKKRRPQFWDDKINVAQQLNTQFLLVGSWSYFSDDTLYIVKKNFEKNNNTISIF